MRTATITIVLISGLLLFSCKENEPVYETMEYNILFGDKLAGYQKSWRNPDGSYGYEFEYNDRGRGPHIEELITVNENDAIIDLRIQGHNYLKDSVNEKFSIENGVASWKSNSEEGKADFDGELMFSAINSSFGSSDLWLKKLLDAEDKKIDLLPSGSISLTSEEVHEIDSLELRLIEYTGQYFTPGYVWVDQNNRLFAYTSSWFNCIRKGYDSLAKQLYPIQKEKEDSYFQELSKNLIDQPMGKVVIKGANLYDSESAALLPQQNVLIEGNTILKVSDDEIDTQGGRIIDATGKTLLPGLFDMHTHIDVSDGILHLAAGVTSVRDMANSFELPDLAKKFNSSELIGPRIVVMSGFIDQSGPYAGPTGAIVDSLEEGLEAIKDYHSKGYQQIKLYSSIDPEWVKPMAQLTHELGMRLSGHIPSFMLAEQAIKDGYDEIQHVNMVALNFLSDTLDTRTPLRFSMVAEHTHALDLESDHFQEFLALLQKNDIALDATVSIFEGMMTTKAGEPDPSFETILDRLPLSVQRGFYSGGLPVPEGSETKFQNSYQKLLDIVKTLYDEGITIVPGTDTMAGFGLHRELENYVRAGISPAEVLQLATLTSAEISGVANMAGSIEEGKWADLILVDGNPLENISDIRNVELTIKDGKIYDPKALYGAIGVKHFK